MTLMKFSILHVAVDNDVLRSFLVFACEASSFFSVYVATLLFFATLQIFFATFAENHFLRLAIGVMSDIGRVQTSKELVVTCKPRTKWSYWQHAVVPWQQPCYLEVCHKAAEISTSWLENFAYFPKISTWVLILHFLKKYVKIRRRPRRDPRIPSGSSSYF